MVHYHSDKRAETEGAPWVLRAKDWSVYPLLSFATKAVEHGKRLGGLLDRIRGLLSAVAPPKTKG